MKIFLTLVLFILAELSADASMLDTIWVKPGDIDVKSLRKGNLGYLMKFDFEAKKAEYKNIALKTGIPDSVIRKGTEGFNQFLAKYNLNWHDDLLIYTMLPYADNRTFVINYYDPGFGGAE
jgi:hypothetical protein